MGFYTKQEVPYSLTEDGSSNNGSNNDSNVELITLNATENKTYNAPSNKAYNKVIVNIPNVIPTKTDFNNIVSGITKQHLPTDPITGEEEVIVIIPFIEYVQDNNGNEFNIISEEEENPASIDELDGWYCVKGKTKFDAISQHISGVPCTIRNFEEEQIEDEVMTPGAYIDIIIQSPTKIASNEIYLIHIFQILGDPENPSIDPEDPIEEPPIEEPPVEDFPEEEE